MINAQGTSIASVPGLPRQAHRARVESLTFINISFTICFMIRSFADNETEHFYSTGKSRRLPTVIHRRASMRLTQLNAATRLQDLRLPPSNRLEALKHDRLGQWSIRINDQWRICFRFENGDAFDVAIVDYH
jgi:toxin HigB-1